jgi:2-keto-3-deoxy-L-rhamnonate aldolase RhmA
MDILDIKEKLRGGGLVTGFWSQSGSPVVAEIFSHAGVDFIALDMEHGEVDVAAFTAFSRAMSGPAVPLARVPENSVIAIRRVLDAGAGGVIVPLVNTAREAAAAAAAVCYPPGGVRGFAFCRANGWGSRFSDYVETFPERALLIVMIETAQAVGAIDEILAVDGVDGVLIGPYDLSGSYGVVGQLGHASVLRAMDSVLKACRRSGKAAGYHVVEPDPDGVRKAVEAGFTFLPLGMDTVFLANGARAVSDIMSSRAISEIMPAHMPAGPARSTG